MFASASVWAIAAVECALVATGQSYVVSRQCDNSINAGYDVIKVSQQSQALASHSWEYGTASEALLELYDPSISVFSAGAFPGGKIPKCNTKAEDYAKQFIRTDSVTLIDGDGALGDPASLGVFAILLGQENQTYMDAATRQADHVLSGPRYWNGAISHRESSPDLWADFVYMGPPFLAYYAVATNNQSLLRESVRQCGLYRQGLQSNTTAPYHGLWHHIIAVGWADLGLWSTGNAWAAAGMARVLATVAHWAPSSGWTTEKAQLVSYIKEIIDGAMTVTPDSSTGLLRNYLDDSTWFGEISGTALLSAVVYRLAVLAPETFGSNYIQWADKNRALIAAHVDSNGIVAPAINPLDWHDTTPFTTGSPEGQSFGVLLYTAYRDCICAGKCQA